MSPHKWDVSTNSQGESARGALSWNFTRTDLCQELYFGGIGQVVKDS